MPKSKRWFVRRDMKQAQARLNKVEDYLARCGQIYEGKHDDIYQAFCTCIAMARLLKETLAKLNDSI